MNKIPTLFVRDPSNMSRVTREVTPGCEWVLSGEGRATVKRDGTNVRVSVEDGECVGLDKRRNPTREEKAQGAEPGYVEAHREDPADKHIWAAVDATDFHDWPDGQHSCEALGPKIQGGVESYVPMLYRFGLEATAIDDATIQTSPSFDALRDYLSEGSIEGIVFHAVDGRMAKIKARDFGVPWPPRLAAPKKTDPNQPHAFEDDPQDHLFCRICGSRELDLAGLHASPKRTEV